MNRIGECKQCGFDTTIAAHGLCYPCSRGGRKRMPKGQQPPLTAEQQALFDEFYPEQVTKMMHARTVRPMLSCYADFEDALSAAVVGLMNAIRRFKPEHGTKFSTYLIWHIRGALQEGVRNGSGRNLIRDKSRGKNKGEQFDTFEQNIVFLSPEYGNERAVWRWDWNPAARPTYHQAEREAEARDFFQHVTANMTERAKSMVHMRYVEGHTYATIGKRYKTSRERCRQIVQRALERVRNTMPELANAA